MNKIISSRLLIGAAGVLALITTGCARESFSLTDLMMRNLDRDASRNAELDLSADAIAAIPSGNVLPTSARASEAVEPVSTDFGQAPFAVPPQPIQQIAAQATQPMAPGTLAPAPQEILASAERPSAVPFATASQIDGLAVQYAPGQRPIAFADAAQAFASLSPDVAPSAAVLPRAARLEDAIAGTLTPEQISGENQNGRTSPLVVPEIETVKLIQGQDIPLDVFAQAQVASLKALPYSDPRQETQVQSALRGLRAPKSLTFVPADMKAVVLRDFGWDALDPASGFSQDMIIGGQLGMPVLSPVSGRVTRVQNVGDQTLISVRSGGLEFQFKGLAVSPEIREGQNLVPNVILGTIDNKGSFQHAVHFIPPRQFSARSEANAINPYYVAAIML